MRKPVNDRASRIIHYSSAAIADPLLRQYASIVVRPSIELSAVSLPNGEASHSMASGLRFHVSGCPETWNLKRGT